MEHSLAGVMVISFPLGISVPSATSEQMVLNRGDHSTADATVCICSVSPPHVVLTLAHLAVNSESSVGSTVRHLRHAGRVEEWSEVLAFPGVGEHPESWLLGILICQSLQDLEHDRLCQATEDATLGSPGTGCARSHGLQGVPVSQD